MICVYNSVFENNFFGYQPTGPTFTVLMFKPKIWSVIRADVYVISSNIVSPDQQSSAIGRRADVNFEH